jgi:TolB protein
MRIGDVRQAATVAAVGLLLGGCGGSGDPRPDLVFVSTRDGDYTIYAMNADGGRQTRLTEAQVETDSPRGLYFQVEPAWSPDGAMIAFASRRAGTSDIYEMNADGTGSMRLTSTKEDDSHPTWSPDGANIACARAGDVFVMASDGSSQRRISDIAAEETEPSWAPDGSWIAYVRRSPGGPFREVWFMRPDGSERHSVTSQSGRAFTPAWSPDSRRIAFAMNPNNQFFDIYTIGADGKDLRRLTRTGHDAFEPAWSPDGMTVAFSRGGAIVMIDVSGNEEEVTDRDNNDSSPAWNPRQAVEAG